MDWLALLAQDDGITLRDGATDDELRQAEAELGARLPEALKDLYRQTNGVWDDPGQWHVIWPLADVVEHNREAGGVETPARRQLIGFGDDGTGSPFCIQRRGGDAVYYWSPVDQAAVRVADDLVSFWTAWVTDTLPAH